jgi:hypothetical protein
MRTTRADVRRLVGDKAWQRACTPNGKKLAASFRLRTGSIRVTPRGVDEVLATRAGLGSEPVDVGMAREDVVEILGPPQDEWRDSTLEFVWREPYCVLCVTVVDGKAESLRLFPVGSLWAESYRILDEGRRLTRELEEARRKLPDYGLVLRRSTGYVSFPRSRTAREATSATVMGVVRNYRQETVDIRVRVEWTSKAGSYAGSAATVLSCVSPGDERDFTVTCDEVFQPHTYEVTLSEGSSP